MNLKRIDSAIEGYRGTLGERDFARLQAFRSVWGVQAELADEAPAWAPAETRDLMDLVERGIPLFSQRPVVIDRAALVNACKRMAQVASEAGLLSVEAAGALSDEVWDKALGDWLVEEAGSNPVAFLEDVQTALSQAGADKDAARIGGLVASLALKPLLSTAAQRAERALKDAGLRHHEGLTCPVCGCAPSVARVGSTAGKQGRVRELWCPQCGTTWEFDRVRCARCGTRNQAHLHFHSIEGDDAHRIASCDECGGYIRTVYLEEGQMLLPFSFEVEDVVMARLDAIALDPTIAGGGSVSDEA